MASSGSSQMTFGDAGAAAMPAAGSCPSTGNDERTDSSGGGAQEGSCTWYSQPPSPAPTETKSPRIDISPRAKPSTALHSGGDSAVPQSVVDISPVRPARLPSQHEPDGGLPKPSVVPPIVGLSSAGVPTSGLTPVSAHLGTPRDERSRSPTHYQELEDRVPPSPQWPDQDVVSHRGEGTIQLNNTAYMGASDVPPRGGDSAVLSRVGRSTSARGSGPRTYGPAGPVRRALTPRVSPRAVPSSKPVSIEDKVSDKTDEILGLRNMMVNADRAYLKIINDGQTTFLAMQREYQELWVRCQMLQATVSEQGQEIYSDGRRIDELGSFILLGTQRTQELGFAKSES